MKDFLNTTLWLAGKLTRLVFYVYSFLLLLSLVIIHSRIVTNTETPEQYALYALLCIVEGLVLILVPIFFFSLKPTIETLKNWTIVGVITLIIFLMSPKLLGLVIGLVHFS